MIDRETIDLILARADITEVVGDYVALSRRGANLVGLCPFHDERTPSFSVSPARGIYKCFGCGKGGNSLNFIMEIEHLSFVEAVRFLAQKVGVEIEERPQTHEEILVQEEGERFHAITEWAQKYFHKQLLDTENGRRIGLSYFEERGLTRATIQKFGLGYCAEAGIEMTEAALAQGWALEDLVKLGITVARENWRRDRFAGRVIFPIRSISGRVIAFGGRILRLDEHTAKYVNSPESSIYHKSNELFGLAFSRKGIGLHDNCLLVEGYMDVLSMWQRGIDNIVASSGTSLTIEQAHLIHRLTKNVTILYDGDSAGIKAAERGAGILLEEGLVVRIVLLPEGQDPDDFARTHTKEEIETYLKTQAQDLICFITNRSLEAIQADPGRKVEVAEAVLSKIALIPDALLRAAYIREANEVFKFGEEVLTDTVNNLRMKRSSTLQRSASRNIQLPIEPQNELVAGKDPRRADYEKGLYVAERELIEVLLRYGTFRIPVDFDESTGSVTEIRVSEYFFEEIDGEDIIITNELLRAIYEEYRDVYRAEIAKDEFATIDMQEHFLLHPSPEISALATDLLQDKYTLSEHWQKGSIPDIEVMEQEIFVRELAERTQIAYKARILMWELTMLKRQLDETEDEQEQARLLLLMAENNKQRLALAELLERLHF